MLGRIGFGELGAAMLISVGLLATAAVVPLVDVQPAQAAATKKAKPKVSKLPVSARTKWRAPGAVVTFKGKKLKNVSKVTVGGKTAKITRKTATRIKVKLPKFSVSKYQWVRFYYKKTAKAKKHTFVSKQKVRVRKVSTVTPVPVTPPVGTPPSTDPVVVNGVTCVPNTARARLRDGSTVTQFQVHDLTCSTLGAFAAKYNQLLVAAGYTAVPLDRFRPGNNLPSAARKSTCGATGQIDEAKLQAAGARLGTGYDVHANRCYLNLDAATGWAGAKAAQAWWDSKPHRKIVYQGNTGIEGGAWTDKWWDKATKVERNISAIPGEVTAMAYFSVKNRIVALGGVVTNDEATDRANLINLRIAAAPSSHFESCVYYVAASTDNGRGNASYASFGACG